MYIYVWLQASRFISTSYKQVRLSNQSISSIIAVASLLVFAAAIIFSTNGIALVLASNITSYVRGFYKLLLPIKNAS